jgi:CRP-like cAMP-binding protein
MHKQKLEKYIQSLLPMSPEKASQVSEKFTSIEILKNDLLIKENKITKDTYVLQSGFIRSFTLDKNGEEVTTNIFSPTCFVNDFLSFFKQLPSSENFQALTPCTLWKMTYQDVQTSFHNIPEFREFGRIMLVTNYANLHSRMLSMIKDTADTRYLNLLNQHPDLLQNIPLKIIASYLGITDTSLSRIRKDLSQK